MVNMWYEFAFHVVAAPLLVRCVTNSKYSCRYLRSVVIKIRVGLSYMPLQCLDAIIEVFQKIPEYIPGIKLSLEYNLTHKDLNVANNHVEGEITYCKFWCVDLYEEILEIYSTTLNTYTLPEDNPPGLRFYLHLNQSNSNSKFYYDEWLEEVKNPELFWTEEYEVEIVINFNGEDFWLRYPY